MSQTVNIPALFLPAHLRLGPSNWREYRHAVETICVLNGVDDNLIYAEAYPGTSDRCANLEKRLQEYDEWVKKDNLCKAIITLNIKDFPRYGVQAGPSKKAMEVWQQLVRLHTKKRSCWDVLFGWVRPLTRLEKLLLGLAFCLLYLCHLLVRVLDDGSRIRERY